jgi:hypothetical protein
MSFFAHYFLVLDLSSCFNNIIDSFILRLLLFIDENFICVVAEFTVPYLFDIIRILILANYCFRFNFLNETVDVENSITFFTYNRISCSNLSVILESFEFNFEDVCINFLSELPCWSTILNLFLGF